MRRIMFVLVFMIGICLFGEAKESGIKLIPVYEKTFEDTIVDVIFDTVTVTLEEAKAMGWKEEAFSEEEKAKGEVVVAYPKVIFYGVPDSPVKGKVKRIEFWGKEDNILKVIDVKRDEDVIKSRRENYILIRKKIREESPYSKWEVYTTDGTMVLKKTGEYGIVPVDISDDGYLAMIRYPTFSGGPFGDGFIYDIRGNKIAEIENPIQVDEGWASAEFSDKGIIFGFSDAYTRSVIKLVDKEGHLRWTKEIMLGSYFLLNSAPGVGIIIIFQDNNIKPYQIYVYCVGWNGEVKWRMPLEIGGIMDIEFEPSTNDIFISSCAGYLWRIRASSGRLVWRHREPWAPDISAKKWPEDIPRFREINIVSNELIVRGCPFNTENKSTTLFAFDLRKNKLLDTFIYSGNVYVKTYKKKIYIISRRTLQQIIEKEVER